jgi:hypothetical protein
MKVPYKTYFFLLIFSVSVFAQGELTLDSLNNRANTLISRTLGEPEKIEELGKKLETAFKESRSKRQLVYEEEVDSNRNSCPHCPTYMQLTGTINAALQKMKESLKEGEQDAVPIDVNRLNFLFYTVKTRQDDGSFKCDRYRDLTPNLKPTQFDGRFDLMAEDSFKFPFGSELQLLDPKKEEIVYYYRGIGPQKNIIVKAILTKDGGKFQYFYYRPTEKELNPYGLLNLGSEPEEDATVASKKVTNGISADPHAPVDDPSKNKYFSSILLLFTSYKIVDVFELNIPVTRSYFLFAIKK